jgi:hypothetical protein
VHRIQL